MEEEEEEEELFEGKTEGEKKTQLVRFCRFSA